MLLVLGGGGAYIWRGLFSDFYGKLLITLSQKAKSLRAANGKTA